MKIRFLILLLLISKVALAAPYPNETRVFNLVSGQARLVSGITIVGEGGDFLIQDANQPWTGIGPDGKSYIVTTLRYSYLGTITLDIDPEFYSAVGNCSFGDSVQVFVGWTVMQPGITGNVYSSAGAAYDDGFGGGVGVQTRWIDVDEGRPNFKAIFSDSSEYAFVFVSRGPQGIFTMPGGRQVYVHGAGQTPNAVPYTDTYGLNCGAVLGVGTVLPSDPVVPINPEIVCDFSISGDINLGTVNKSTALGTRASTTLSSRCTGDADLIATIRTASGQDNILELGGLEIPVTFENGASQLKFTANTGTTSTNIFAEITKADALETGEHSKSMVVYLSYW